MKLIGVMIGSQNPDKLGEFYTKVFGAPGWQQGDWYGYSVGGGSLVIGSHSEVKGQSETPARMIISIVSDDLQTECNRITELGARVVAAPYQPDKDKNPDTWLATFADPDGNYLQLATPWEM
jgi:predicted enzyme related to lactoylglutathione lyase